MGNGHPSDVRIAKETLRVVDFLKTLDNSLAVDGLDRAELPDPLAGEPNSRGQGMPGAAELSDQRPDLVRRSGEIDRFGKGLQFSVRRCEIRKHLHAGLGRAGRAAQEELAVIIDEPGEQDIDYVRIDRATTSRLIRTTVQCALLDLEVALVGNRLGHIEQQKIVEEDVCVGSER